MRSEVQSNNESLTGFSVSDSRPSFLNFELFSQLILPCHTSDSFKKNIKEKGSFWMNALCVMKPKPLLTPRLSWCWDPFNFGHLNFFWVEIWWDWQILTNNYYHRKILTNIVNIDKYREYLTNIVNIDKYCEYWQTLLQEAHLW